MAEKEFDNEINFSKVLFLHINRILMSQDDNVFISSVGLLEDTLFPYMDDDYTDDLEGAHDGIGAAANLDPAVRAKRQIIAQEEMKQARLKFRALMSLAERKGLLLEKRGEGYDTENDEK